MGYPHVDWDEPQIYVSESAHGPRPTVACRGELDLRNADQLRAAAISLLPVVGPNGMEINLSAVPFMDARGIAALLSIRRLLRGRPLRLTGIGRTVQRALEAFGLEHLFVLEPVPAAEQAFELAVDVLATYRLTRLATTDVIGETMRKSILRRLGVEHDGFPTLNRQPSNWSATQETLRGWPR